MFTITRDTNNITLHASLEEAEAITNAESFQTEARFAELAADWPVARLIEIWNCLPGATPVKKFKDLGQSLLPAPPRGQEQNAPASPPEPGVQMDSHHLSLLEGR